MTTDPKEHVLTCLKLYGAGDFEALAPLVRDDYRDHGLPFQTATRGDWIEVSRKLPFADLRIDIRRVVAEGDYVTLFSRRTRPGLDIAVTDLFRLQDGLIAERWEVVQHLPADSPDPLATL
ncbi:putative SnoaL-like aldol condensation-catalyzing enzyme [Actinocorallia herbida]|uniref:Putative SnoaL-like aldol condensation-catalyzing enzyme n=1 Tax=Actinocorallia herbida TaxID=58109 RepID=A0A3N1CUJ3_9ACTN|nr:nuclear transport factor 2 family protein [Actinocorallia herbida]ROO84962.1 putative SnoaL-like aldol condensation-catalyzing enzyme [Actinocorallia herbida]